jgi:molybdate transport system substrate-binding protein
MKRMILTGLLLVFVGFYPNTGFSADALLVFAGAGLRVPLDEIGTRFTAEYGIEVVYDYEGSGRLGNKILAGQKPDLFIPGGQNWAKMLKEKGHVTRYRTVAFHVPVMVTPLNTNKVNQLQDFMKKDVRLALGDAAACAIGKADAFIFEKAGLDETKMNIVARGVTVNQLVSWIENKNADASIVWEADARQSKKMRMIPIPENFNHIEVIPVCEMANPPHPQASEKYANFLLGEGRNIFKAHGFTVNQ